MIKVRITYHVVTPDSAEQGEHADHGFYSPGGWYHSIADDDFEARAAAVGREQALRDMAPEPLEYETPGECLDRIRGYGPVESSEYPNPGPNAWLTTYEPWDENLETGAKIYLSFHLEGSDADKLEVIRELT